jgi:TRAP-type C4-dicarboxylate transport system permease small subunit
LKAQSLGFIIVILCFVFAIYLAGLSFQIGDTSLRVQLLSLSTAFFVAGIAILISMIILLASKKLF